MSGRIALSLILCLFGTSASLSTVQAAEQPCAESVRESADIRDTVEWRQAEIEVLQFDGLRADGAEMRVVLSLPDGSLSRPPAAVWLRLSVDGEVWSDGCSRNPYLYRRAGMAGVRPASLRLELPFILEHRPTATAVERMRAVREGEVRVEARLLSEEASRSPIALSVRRTHVNIRK